MLALPIPAIRILIENPSPVLELNPKSEKKKRIRYKIPTYKKADKIRENILKYKHNQKHIFRYKTLDRIYQLIAQEIFNNQQKIYFFDFDYLFKGVRVYITDDITEAEIEGTQNLPIGKRLKIHIELLRRLRRGEKLYKSIREIKKEFKIKRMMQNG